MLVPLPEALQSVCGSKSVPTLRAKLPSHSPWLRPSPGGSTDSKQPQPARCRLYMMRQVHASARQWQRQPPLPAHVASLLQPGPLAAARHALPATAQSMQHSDLNALRVTIGSGFTRLTLPAFQLFIPALPCCFDASTHAYPASTVPPAELLQSPPLPSPHFSLAASFLLPSGYSPLSLAVCCMPACPSCITTPEPSPVVQPWPHNNPSILGTLPSLVSLLCLPHAPPSVGFSKRASLPLPSVAADWSPAPIAHLAFPHCLNLPSISGTC